MGIESVEELLQRGKEAVLNNDYALGRSLLSQVVQRDPQNEQGWLWLSGLLNNPERMRFCLERVIHINPANSHAIAALEDLNDKARGRPPAPPSTLTASGAVSRSIPHHRPASMVEGDPVTSLSQTHNRIRWAYLMLWSLIWALHLILYRRQVAGPQPTLAVVVLAALGLAVAQSGAWLVLLQMLRRTQVAHVLRRSTLNDALSMAIWPSGMLALLGLVLAALAQGADPGTAAAGAITRLILGLLSLGFLWRGLLRELAPDLHERAARQALGKAFMVFLALWGLTLLVGWYLLSFALGA